MKTTPLPEIRMRSKHQFTLPARIVREASIQQDDMLTVVFLNGNIIITPKRNATTKDDVMSYAGMFRGTWGDSNEQVETTIHNTRNEWAS